MWVTPSSELHCGFVDRVKCRRVHREILGNCPFKMQISKPYITNRVNCHVMGSRFRSMLPNYTHQGLNPPNDSLGSDGMEMIRNGHQPFLETSVKCTRLCSLRMMCKFLPQDRARSPGATTLRYVVVLVRAVTVCGSFGRSFPLSTVLCLTPTPANERQCNIISPGFGDLFILIA